jgi:hypothetical protein
VRPVVNSSPALIELKWLPTRRLYLTEHRAATIEQASCRGIPGAIGTPGHDEAARTLRAMAQEASRRA